MPKLVDATSVTSAVVCIACGDTGLSTSGGSCVPCVLSDRVVDWATCFHDFSQGVECRVCGAVRVERSAGMFKVTVPPVVRFNRSNKT